jgi:hypothetical protein
MNVNLTRFSFKPIAVVAAIATAFAITAFSGVGQAQAADPGDPDFLGTAETFVIITANTVTDVGPVMGSEVHGDVGTTATSPVPVELDPTQVINGAIYADDPTPDPVAMRALTDA